jgi:hypothetical protein
VIRIAGGFVKRAPKTADRQWAYLCLVCRAWLVNDFFRIKLMMPGSTVFHAYCCRGDCLKRFKRRYKQNVREKPEEGSLGVLYGAW